MLKSLSYYFKSNKKTLRTPVVLLAITTFSSITLSSGQVFANDSITDQVNVTVSVSCSLTGTGMDSHTKQIINGTYESGIGTTTLKAFCNDNEGFSIYAIGFTGDQYTGEDHTKLIGASNGGKITSGTATSGSTSNWAMKLNTVSSPTPTYPITLDNGFGSYSTVPDTYTKVAHRDSGTDVGTNAEGSTLTTTYAAFMSGTQAADTYTGKVKYTLVHPVDEEPLAPQPTIAGYINYYPNTSTAEGTMGRQALEYTRDWSQCTYTDYESFCQGQPEEVDITDFNDYDWDQCTETDWETYCLVAPEIDIDTLPTLDYAATTLFASNFSRDGYGFAGWSDAYDYESNPDAKYYGPNEDVIFPAETVEEGLALYAVWIKSVGEFQDSSKVSQLCGTSGSLTPATYNNKGDTDESTWSINAGLSSISALTDNRDNQTYAIAKLSDNKCWMIENLRIADVHQENGNTVPTTLTIANTNNPLNDGTNVTLKHNYNDTVTYPTLASSWCYASSCANQSSIKTSNTTNRTIFTSTSDLYSDANLYSYGNYYNWYSATAGRGNSSTTGNVVGDLCPAGWRLPTGGDTGEFGQLNNSLGGYKIGNRAQLMNDETSPTAEIMAQRDRHFPNNFVYSGSTQINMGGKGESATYPSSTGIGGNMSCSYNLTLETNYIDVEGQASCQKNLGRTIRCLANN